jgi:glycyl-tRNA synthetase
VFYDESGNIGRRYRRQDEVGTPFCITYDFDSESDARVTVRERDSMTQERIPVDGLRAYLQDRLETAR